VEVLQGCERLSLRYGCVRIQHTEGVKVEATIREATNGDLAAIVQLIPRLRAFGPVRHRSEEVLDAGERRTIERYFEARPPGSQLWVAEHPAKGVSGVAYAERMIDYFTQAPHGHLGILAVAERAEGLGIARALMRQVEDWSRENGYSILTLNVFAANERARAFYERAGFEIDTLRYAKPLRHR